MQKIHPTPEQMQKIKAIELEILVEVDRLCRKHGIRYTIAYGTLIGVIRHKGFIPWDDDIDICMPREDYIRFRDICSRELDSRFFYQTQATDPEYYHLFDKIRANGTVFRETFLSEYDIHHGVYLDIFPVDALPENKLVRWWQHTRYQLCRLGLNSKYLVLDARSGKKKLAAAALRVLYAPISLDFLYRKAEKYAQLYNDRPITLYHCFASAYKLKDFFPAHYYTEVTEGEFEGRSFQIPAHYHEILTQIYGDYMQLPPEEHRNTRHDLTALDV